MGLGKYLFCVAAEVGLAEYFNEVHLILIHSDGLVRSSLRSRNSSDVGKGEGRGVVKI